MSSFRGFRFPIWTILAVGISAGLFAQPAPRVGTPGDAPQSFGVDTQDEWISASQFAIQASGFAWYQDSVGYWHALGAPGTLAGLEAPVNLPAGAQMSLVECFFKDTDPVDDGLVVFWRRGYDVSTETPNNDPLGMVSTTGSGGFQRTSFPLSDQVIYTLGTQRYLYALDLYVPTGTTVEFRGCRVAWSRSVSPGPATATFLDVPKASPQFKFVEALAAAGITAGCGGGNFCPDAAITRGQMAVFLAVALGLHFPN